MSPIVTADEINYQEVSERITLLNCEIAEKKESMARYAYEHQLRTSNVCQELDRLRGDLECLERQLQNLLPRWSDLKWKVNGW